MCNEYQHVSIHLPFLDPPIATHSNFILLFCTCTKHHDRDKDGRHNAMGTCLHNNILVLDHDYGALHWCSLAIRSSIESASEPRGIKLKDAFIHISNFRGRNHHDISNELLQSGGRLYQPNNCYVNNVYLWKIDLFSHKFYLNLYMYEISTLTIICLGGLG